VLTNSKHFPFSSAVASIWPDQLSLSGSSGSMSYISLHAVNWVWVLILYESVSTKVLPFLNVNRLEDWFCHFFAHIKRKKAMSLFSVLANIVTQFLWLSEVQQKIRIHMYAEG
jgi:hypothetical protein